MAAKTTEAKRATKVTATLKEATETAYKVPNKRKFRGKSQRDVLRIVAEANGGVVRVAPAAQVLIDLGLVKGADDRAVRRNAASSVVTLLQRPSKGEEFKRTARGVWTREVTR